MEEDTEGCKGQECYDVTCDGPFCEASHKVNMLNLDDYLEKFIDKFSYVTSDPNSFIGVEIEEKVKAVAVRSNTINNIYKNMVKQKKFYEMANEDIDQHVADTDRDFKRFKVDTSALVSHKRPMYGNGKEEEEDPKQLKTQQTHLLYKQWPDICSLCQEPIFNVAEVLKLSSCRHYICDRCCANVNVYDCDTWTCNMCDTTSAIHI